MPDGSRCFLEVQVHYLRAGISIGRENTGKRYPYFEVCYRLADLLPVSAIFGFMQQNAIDPTVHVWDEKKEYPEVAVIFSAPKPDKALLDAVMGATRYADGAHIPHPESNCTEVVTTGWANLAKRDVKLFLDAFRRNGKRSPLYVTDAETADLRYPDIICTFEIKEVRLEMPRFFR